jgi:hypothetical protein
MGNIIKVFYKKMTKKEVLGRTFVGCSLTEFQFLKQANHMGVFWLLTGWPIDV